VIVIPAAPTNSAPPSITGIAGLGQTLSETQGSWSGHPTSYRYQWQDCDSTGNTCAVIAGATAQTYTTTATDVGHRIRVAEYAVNAGGTSNPATSAATAIVPVSDAGGTSNPATSAATAIVPVSPGTQGAAAVNRATVNATSVHVPVSCTGGFGAICQLKLSLTLIETIRGGKPVAVAAARRPVKRTIVLAAATTSLSAPQSTTVQLTLGRVGDRLLRTFRVLRVRLTVTQANRVLRKATVTFRTKAKPKHH
jgi:hypothetical protein